MDTFQPLSPEQYQKARAAGFSPDQIIQNEKRRKTEVSVSMPQQPAQQQGFLSKVGHGALNVLNQIESPFAGLGAIPVQALAKATGQPDPYAQGMPGFAGTKVPVSQLGVEQKLGDAAQVGSYFIPGEGPLAATAMGAAQGVGSAMSQGQGLAPTLTSGVIGGGLGLATFGLAKGAGALLEGAGGENALRQSAAKDIEGVLAPTTKANKFTTQKIAPELAKRGVTAPSRTALLEKATNEQEITGQALESAYEALPQDAKFEVSGLLQGLGNKMDELTINGHVPEAAGSNLRALESVQRDLINLGVKVGEDGQSLFSDVANVRKLRQILDSGKKTFVASDLDAAKKQAENTLANLIREQFGKQFPDIAKLNKDYSFWSKVSQVLGDTIQRKTGQSGIMKTVGREILGASVGAPSGHPIVGAALVKVLGDVVDSAGWKTASAALKTKLADALARANFVEANGILSKIIQGTGKVLQNPATTRAVTGGLVPTILKTNQ